jgi:hypothetical protein
VLHGVSKYTDIKNTGGAAQVVQPLGYGLDFGGLVVPFPGGTIEFSLLGSVQAGSDSHLCNVYQWNLSSW